jgi:choline-sulfatase
VIGSENVDGGHGCSMSWLLFVAAMAAICACRDRESKPSLGAVGTSSAAPRDVEGRASARAELETARPLLEEAARAEMDVDGLLIDFGTGDEYKYTRGGWRTGWAGASVGKDGATWASIDERRAWLDLGGSRPAPARLAMRARSSVPGQEITVYVGETAVGRVLLSAAWTTIQIEIDPRVPIDPAVRWELRSSKGASGRPRAEIDWLWLARKTAPAEPPLDSRVRASNLVGVVRRALAAATPRAYSFYLIPDAGSSLVVDLGAERSARFTVTIEVDGGQVSTLVQESHAGSWSERVVSLDPFAGKAVRLSLRTDQQDGWAGWGEPELMRSRAGGAEVGTRPVAPRNVVFVVMDTTRADAFAPFAGPDRVAQTPRYDALATRSVVFANAYNNENWTKPSVATLLSGLYPSTHDTKRDASSLPDDVELVGEHLQRAGFATAGFVANGYVSDKFGFEQGWDTFRNYIRESRRSEAEHVVGDAVAWLKRHVEKRAGQPFFLYIQTIDAHVTYDVGREYWGRYFDGTYDGSLGSSISAEDQVRLTRQKSNVDPRDVGWLRALYWGEVTYQDEHLGALLDALDRLDVRDETLLVMTNDHGEELGERGAFGHGHQIREEMIRAPLLMSHGSLPAGHVVEEVVEHVDVAPTVLDALGRKPLADADGTSLLPRLRGQPSPMPYAIIEFLDGRRALRTGTYKLIARADDHDELYELASDPRETRDTAAIAAIARRMCEVYLGEGLAVPRKTERLGGVADRRQFRAGEARIDPRMRRQLEALGYLGVGSRTEGEVSDGN